MFLDNDTTTVEKSISNDSMKAHISRNVIVFIAIFLTTLMITGVLSTGIVFYNAEVTYSNMSPGLGADGFAIMGGKEQEKKIKEKPEVEWAALVRNASYRRIENPHTVNCDVELLVTNTTYYDNNYISLLDGNYPNSKTDILISDTLVQKFSFKNAIGRKIPFTVTIHENNQEIKKEFYFTICGIYKNPLAGISDTYEEVYTSNGFVKSYNPQIQNKPGYIYVKLSGNKGKDEIYQQLQKINDEVGGIGVVSKTQNADNGQTVKIVLAAIVIIMLAAYFIIFNIFSISLSKDIRYYGMLKTIGATTRQIRATLNRQVYKLLFPALILGLFVGHICGRIIAPEILGLMDGLKNFYQPAPILLPSCFVIIFVCVTVKISCYQSFRKVSKISPIEAAHFITPVKRINTIFAIMSLILSCMIFNSVLTFFFGYDLQNEVNKRNVYDFKLMNNIYLYGNGNESFESIPEELCNQIKDLPFVKRMDIVYSAHSQPDNYEDVLGNTYYLRGRVKNVGLLKEDFERAKSQDLTYDFDKYGNDLMIPICGVSSDILTKILENKNIKILDGTINTEQFINGEYIIYQPFGRTEDSLVHAGDEMDIQFFDDTKQEYITKHMKVMAVVIGNDSYGSSPLSEIGICLPDKLFKEIYPNYNEMISSVVVDSNNTLYMSEQQKEIEHLLGKYSCYQTTFTSKYNSTMYFEKERNTYFLMGMFLAIFFSIIGITNIINSIVSNILSERIAYARLQAVGMTKKQLIRKIIINNFKVYGLSVLLFIPMNFVLLHFILSGFDTKLFVLSALLVSLGITIILIFTSWLVVKYLNKKTIAQRLREID